MIDGIVSVRDFELMVSETEMSKAGKGPMNIEIHWALADELITLLREAEKDAARYRWLRDESKASDFDLMVHLEPIEWNDAIDQAMKERGDE